MPLYPAQNLKKDKKYQLFSTRRWVGIIVLCVTIIGWFAMLSPYLPLLKSFLYGMFGIFIFLILSITTLISVLLIQERIITVYPKIIKFLIFASYSLLCIFSLAFNGVDVSVNYMQYLINIYSLKYSISGIMTAILIYPVAYFTDIVSSYIIFAIIFILNIGIAINLSTKKHFRKLKNGTYLGDDLILNKNTNSLNTSKNYVSLNELFYKNSQRIETKPVPVQAPPVKPISKPPVQKINKNIYKDNGDIISMLDKTGRESYVINSMSEIFKKNKDYEEENNITNSVQTKSNNGFLDTIKDYDEQNNTVNDFEAKRRVLQNFKTNELLKKLNENDFNSLSNYNLNSNDYSYTNSNYEAINKDDLDDFAQETKFKYEKNNYNNGQIISNTYDENNKYNDMYDDDNDYDENEYDDQINFDSDTNSSSLVDENQDEDINYNNTSIIKDIENNNFSSKIDPSHKNKKVDYDFSNNTLKSDRGLPKGEKPKRKRKPYVAPPISLLTDLRTTPPQSEEVVRIKQVQIEEKFKSFGIDARVVDYIVGPRVTRYEVEIPPGIKLNTISSFTNDIKAAVESVGDILLHIPLPGKKNIGIDVPNNETPTISFKEMIKTKEFANSAYNDIFVVGKTITGDNLFQRLEDMPHMMVAGSTGSGKSVFLNSLLISLIFHSTPEDLRFILIDPKFVEFADYAGIPHMLIEKPIDDINKAIKVLDFAIDEMNCRYKAMLECGCKKIEDYNKCQKVVSGEYPRKSKILIVIDEVGDLMSQPSKRDLEMKIVILAQKARAAGIYMVLATQRPTSQIITGNIKTNLPARISFKLGSGIDSRVILDKTGAENLLGKGDMLFKASSAPTIERLQGCYLPDNDIKAITDFIKENNDCFFDEEVEERINKMGGEVNKSSSGIDKDSDSEDDYEDESLVPNALRICLQAGHASISMLQRKLGIGYNRSANLVDYLESLGYVSAPINNGKREVLITEEEFEEKFGDF